MSIWRKVLNLPEKKTKQSKNVYVAAADSAGAWDLDTRRGPKIWAGILRGLIITVLLLAIISGIKSWFRSSPPPPPAPQPAPEQTFPQVAASGAACRFALAYLSWDEAAPQARVDSLKRMGWKAENGLTPKGKAVAANATTASLEVVSSDVAKVTVVVDQTVGLATMPVAIKIMMTSHLSIVGAPSYVAVPTIDATDPNPIKGDSALAEETRETAKAFFAAIGADQNVTALTAPGSSIRGIGNLKFVDLGSWQVQPDNADSATALAKVTWTQEQSQIVQTYRLSLRKTTAGSISRWAVYSID